MQEENNFLKTEWKGAFRHRILTKLTLKEVGEMHLNGTNWKSDIILQLNLSNWKDTQVAKQVKEEGIAPLIYLSSQFISTV